MYQRRDLIEGMMRAAIRAGQNHIKNTDQIVLNHIVWPSAQYDVVRCDFLPYNVLDYDCVLIHQMAHDSFHCQNVAIMAKTLTLRIYPFPTQRQAGYFIGGVAQQKLLEKCPVPCRPLDHKDWEQC